MASDQQQPQNQSQEAQWDGKSLKRKCECEMCRQGLATTHNDDSHDQSLNQKIVFNNQTITIFGGTTKCARIFLNYLTDKQKNFEGKKIVEVGSGTGLVGTALLLLGADVTLTDQEPVLELLRGNVEANTDSSKHKYNIQELLWGSETHLNNILKDQKTINYVIGSDLIYAKEGIPALVATYEVLLKEASSIGMLALIRRFKWEETFFELMNKSFETKLVHEDGDIQVLEFRKKIIIIILIKFIIPFIFINYFIINYFLHRYLTFLIRELFNL